MELAVVDEATRLADDEESKDDHFGFRYAVKMKRGMVVLEPQSILSSGGHLLGSWPHYELWFNFRSVVNPQCQAL